MNTKMITILGITAAGVGAGLAMAPPASAGGIGDFLSPSFGSSCANHHGVRADGATTHGTGAANGNLAGLPIGSPFNQCGGADLDVCVIDQAGPLFGQMIKQANQGVDKAAPIAGDVVELTTQYLTSGGGSKVGCM